MSRAVNSASALAMPCPRQSSSTDRTVSVPASITSSCTVGSPSTARAVGQVRTPASVRVGRKHGRHQPSGPGSQFNRACSAPVIVDAQAQRALSTSARTPRGSAMSHSSISDTALRNFRIKLRPCFRECPEPDCRERRFKLVVSADTSLSTRGLSSDAALSLMGALTCKNCNAAATLTSSMVSSSASARTLLPWPVWPPTPSHTSSRRSTGGPPGRPDRSTFDASLRVEEARDEQKLKGAPISRLCRAKVSPWHRTVRSLGREVRYRTSSVSILRGRRSERRSHMAAPSHRTLVVTGARRRGSLTRTLALHMPCV